MIQDIFSRVMTFIYSPIGLILASMFAGEYVKPGQIVSRLLDRVRGQF